MYHHNTHSTDSLASTTVSSQGEYYHHHHTYITEQQQQYHQQEREDQGHYDPSYFQYQQYPQPTQSHRNSFYNRRTSQSSSVFSERSCGSMTDAETRKLWRCMLELQERYGCYKSTRIDLALSAGDAAVDFMPNRFIIDVLNDSIIDLPEEGWDLLDRHLDYAPPKMKVGQAEAK